MDIKAHYNNYNALRKGVHGQRGRCVSVIDWDTHGHPYPSLAIGRGNQNLLTNQPTNTHGYDANLNIRYISIRYPEVS